MSSRDQLYICDQQYRITESTFVAPRNDPMRFYAKKPAIQTGLWTSSYVDGSSAWVEWCEGANFGDPSEMSWVVLTPAENVRLYEIDSLKDLNRLLKEYPHLPPEPMRSYLTSFLDFASIDFERMASQGYDGIHLTEKGNNEVHCSFPVDMNRWDVESTLWFRAIRILTWNCKAGSHIRAEFPALIRIAWFRWCFVAEREVQPLVSSLAQVEVE